MRLKYLTVLGFTALFLLVLEGGLEYRAHRRGFGSILFGAAGVRFEGGTQAGEKIPTAFGPTEEFPFRSPIIPPGRSSETTRIWFASASHAEDIAVPVPGVFPNRMGDILEEQGIPVEILNASRAGLSIVGNRRELLEHGEFWAPDYVVFYGLSMDLGDLSSLFLGSNGGEEDEEEAEDGAEEGATQEDGSVSGPFLRLNKLYERTTVYAQLKSNVTSLVTRERILADTLPTVAKDRFKERVVEFLDTSEELGSTPVLITFTTSHSLAGSTPAPRSVDMFILRFNPYLTPRGWLQSIDELNQVIKDVADERDVLLFDLATEMVDRPGRFRDPVHFTPEGHRIVAEFLAGEFARILLPLNDGGPR